MNKKLIIISGSTATGKTATSISLAKIAKKQFGLNPVIVNFDSLNFFKELTIGTAKPTLKEREGIPHELFDVCSIDQEFNASKYIELAEEKINSFMQQNKQVFLVGGSAFYLRALIKGMYDSEKISQELKNKTMEKYNREGIKFIIDYLKRNDPLSLELLHANDHYRLTRAYYHHMTSGKSFSSEKAKMEIRDPYDLENNIEHNWNIHHIYLNIPKEDHYQIIKKRTSKMMEQGLIQEVTDLLKKGYSQDLKPLKSIGYKEVLEFLSDDNLKINSEEELLEKIFISTRQLAKSQRTFFKKLKPKIEYNPLINADTIEQDFLKFISEN